MIAAPTLHATCALRVVFLSLEGIHDLSVLTEAAIYPSAVSGMVVAPC